jgi:hypothetical protein
MRERWKKDKVIRGISQGNKWKGIRQVSRCTHSTILTALSLKL